MPTLAHARADPASLPEVCAERACASCSEPRPRRGLEEGPCLSSGIYGLVQRGAPASPPSLICSLGAWTMPYHRNAALLRCVEKCLCGGPARGQMRRSSPSVSCVAGSRFIL